MTEPSPPRVMGRLFRGYGPLIGFAAVFLAISLLVPTQAKEIVTETRAASDTEADGLAFDDTVVAAETTVPGAADPAAVAAAAEAEAKRVAGTKGSGGAKPGTPGSRRQGAAGAAANTVATSCGAQQVPGDPYSPPCIKWGGGENGGATSKGVSKDAIKVSVRIQAFENGITDALSRVAGTKIPNENPAMIENTIRGVTDYFNKYYQFYGRKLQLEIYKGKGALEREILGGGQEGAQADALKVGTEIKAFADVSSVSPPYSDALAKQGVINIGAPYISREYLTRLRPYSWSQLTDCSTVVETVGSYYLAKLAGKPAVNARGDLKGKPRRTAVIGPDNSWYQECVRAGVKIIQDGGGGGDIVMVEPYRIDLNDMVSQATSLVAKFKSAGVTTIVCGCDPILLVYMTNKANEQQYFPEFVQTGVAFTDQDIVGQIMNQNTYGGTVGVSFAGPTVPIRGGPGYKAFKAVRPNEEPSQAADLIFYQLQLLAIGVQMAGPNLTPDTFEAGMFKYPARSGPAGTWKFGPGDYTTSQDAREVYFNSTARSPQNNEPGAWIDPSNGTKRYPIGGFPPGEPPTRP
ncbi:MAG TPA: hypothetical protein VJM33_15905 [Microthrixaceae bacterium]|nr:hypothetical protein [Microthrixaceae bacterium]